VVVLGLIVTLIGIACGMLALGRTWTEHAPGQPLVPVTKPLAVARGKAGRLLSRRRPEEMVSKKDSDLLTGGIVEASGSLGLKMLPKKGATTDELVDLLMRRVDRIEAIAEADRSAAHAEAAELRSDLEAVTNRLDAETRQLEAATRSLAVGTVRLQLAGLILVGIGTALMAVPSL
jgi:hypothetical protein